MKNKHKVPVKQWRRWSIVAQGVFNEVFSEMLRDQCQLLHPQAAVAKREHWRTTCWNAAWIAADAVMKSPGLALTVALVTRLR